MPCIATETHRKAKSILSVFGLKPLEAETQACDDQTMHKPAKVYPPYRDGKKWRLVIVEAGIRKAVTVNTLEKAEALREELTRTLTTKGARSVGDVLAEWLDYKQEQGLTALYRDAALQTEGLFAARCGSQLDWS